MARQEPLYELLYTSSLAPTASAGDIAGIARVSRAHNADCGITGALIFDGQRFCQYLEGPGIAVLNLVRRIASDPRHVDFVIRHQGPLSGPRRFPAWHLGYALAHEGHDLDALADAQGDEAVARLLQLVPQCELDP